MNNCNIALDFTSMFKDNVDNKNINTKIQNSIHNNGDSINNINENEMNDKKNKNESFNNEDEKIQWVTDQLLLNNIYTTSKEIKESNILNILYSIIEEVSKIIFNLFIIIKC